MVVFAQPNEARCSVENEDVVGAAPTGDAPTTSEWLTILLLTKVRLILETWRYILNHPIRSQIAYVTTAELSWLMQIFYAIQWLFLDQWFSFTRLELWAEKNNICKMVCRMSRCRHEASPNMKQPITGTFDVLVFQLGFKWYCCDMDSTTGIHWGPFYCWSFFIVT